MNLPLDNPIVHLFYQLFNTPGLGGLGVGFIVVACLGSIAGGLYWITRGALDDDPATFAYPTPAFHDHRKGSEPSRK